MKNDRGVIKILILIICALIVGIAATYWYVEKGLPQKPTPLEITYKEVPKDGDGVPYQPIVPPEPIDPNYQVYEDTTIKFQYPKDWTAVADETGIVLRDTANVSSTIIFDATGVPFPDLFTECATSTSVVIAGQNTKIEYLCDRSNKKTRQTAAKNTIWLTVNTGTAYSVYGSIFKDSKEEDKSAYLEKFNHILTTIEFKIN